METAEEREARRILERQKREQEEYDRLAEERLRIQQEAVAEMLDRAKMDKLETDRMTQEARIFEDRVCKAEYKTENLVTASKINEELSQLAANNDQELVAQNANMLRTEALLSQLESERASRQRIQVSFFSTTCICHHFRCTPVCERSASNLCALFGSTFVSISDSLSNTILSVIDS